MLLTDLRDHDLRLIPGAQAEVTAPVSLAQDSREGFERQLGEDQRRGLPRRGYPRGQTERFAAIALEELHRGAILPRFQQEVGASETEGGEVAIEHLAQLRGEGLHSQSVAETPAHTLRERWKRRSLAEFRKGLLARGGKLAP